MTTTSEKKSIGSILGGAIGDALGYEVEFSPLSEITQRYGIRGIRDLHLDAQGIARFSDDTQMTLFTAEGLLTAIRAKEGAIDPALIREDITDAYLAWYATQTEFQLPVRKSWLSNIRDLWSRRAPGNTCLNALYDIKEGRMVLNSSKGCGGVMRVAPIGIFFGAHPDVVCHDSSTRPNLIAEIAGDAALITHHHDMSTFPSALLALIIYWCFLYEKIDRALLRSIVEESLQNAVSSHPESHYADPFRSLMIQAMDLAESDISDFDAILRLGQGWVAEETLAIALFSAMRYIDDFEKCIVCAVNHDGDSDSTGAVAGNIIGAILGYDAIPRKFVNDLELRDILISVAEDLAGTSSDEQMEARYSEHKPYGVWHDLTLFGTMKFTPDHVTSLGPDEIFVFGSNLEGRHSGGAARIARQYFGAVPGQGTGLQGQSYAIPTMQGGVETIKPYVEEFLDFAEACDQNTFLVTRIGCGIAGFRDEEIAPLFRRALRMYNVRLPESFVRILLCQDIIVKKS